MNFGPVVNSRLVTITLALACAGAAACKSPVALTTDEPPQRGNATTAGAGATTGGATNANNQPSSIEKPRAEHTMDWAAKVCAMLSVAEIEAEAGEPAGTPTSSDEVFENDFWWHADCRVASVAKCTDANAVQGYCKDGFV